MTDAELAREFMSTPGLNWANIDQKIAALLARVRLSEHRFCCLYCYQGAVGCDRGRKLEQAAGGSAAAKGEK